MRTVEVGRGGARALAYAPDGTLYAATGAGRVVAIGVNGEVRELFRVPARESGGSFLLVRPGGGDVVHATLAPHLSMFRVWDVARARLVFPGNRELGPAGEFSFEEDERAIRTAVAATFSGPGHLAVHQADTVRVIGIAGPDPPPDREFTQLTRGAAKLAGSGEGSRLAVATTRGTVVIWDAIGLRLLSQIKLTNRVVPQALAVSQTGVVAVALADELRFYDAESDTLTAASLTAKPATMLALSPVADVCLSGDGGPGVTVWRGGKPAGRFDFGVGKVRAIAVAPDGLTAVVGGTARQVAVIDLEG